MLEEWKRALEAHPGNHRVIRGAATLMALDRPDEARALLERALEASPDDPEMWRDLGRISRNPSQRLAALRRARALGSSTPTLLVRIAHTAVLAAELDTAAAACDELETQLNDARATHGEALDWAETGRALWARARERTGDDDAALRLTQAISDYAYRWHWLHTVRGLIAAAQGDGAGAVGTSARLGGDASRLPDTRLRAVPRPGARRLGPRPLDRRRPVPADLGIQVGRRSRPHLARAGAAW